MRHPYLRLRNFCLALLFVCVLPTIARAGDRNFAHYRHSGGSRSSFDLSVGFNLSNFSRGYDHGYSRPYYYSRPSYSYYRPSYSYYRPSYDYCEPVYYPPPAYCYSPPVVYYPAPRYYVYPRNYYRPYSSLGFSYQYRSGYRR